MSQAQSKQPCAQVKLYNRHFYLRKAEHQLLQIQHQQQIKQMANLPKITPSSYAILCKKLQANIHTAINNIVSHSETLCFQQMQQIIKYFQNTLPSEQTFHFQLWLLISGYEIKPCASKDVLHTVLRILMDPYNLSVKEMKQLIIKIPQFQNIDQKRLQLIHQQPDIEHQTLEVNQLLTYWNNYKYTNNTSFKKNQQQFKQLLKQQSSKLTFKPAISKKSQLIAEKNNQQYIQKNKIALNHIRFNKSNNQLEKYIKTQQHSHLQQQSENQFRINHHQLLFHRKLEKDLFLKTLQPNSFQQNLSPLNSRVGKPDEIQQIVNNLYFKKPKKQDVNHKQKEELQQLKLCTFKPKINRDNSARSISPSIKNYSKQIQRLHRGREEQKRKKTLYDNLGRVKKPAQCYKAPSFIERDTPKLILQIKIDQSRVEKIKLKGDQDPKIVAKKFVNKHNLSESMQIVLEELVEEQLNNL